MLKKLWNDPVWSKVIAGVILSVIMAGLASFLNWWPTIGRFIKKVWEYIFSNTTIPN
jgi:hypothetical protein